MSVIFPSLENAWLGHSRHEPPKRKKLIHTGTIIATIYPKTVPLPRDYTSVLLFSHWPARPLQSCRHVPTQHLNAPRHPGGNPGANLKSISHRCHPILGAFVWELTKETIELPVSCLQGGS